MPSPRKAPQDRGSGPVMAFIPVLLDRRRMAAALCLSEDTLDQLRKIGLPSISVPGTSKILFNPTRVVQWLEAENTEREENSESAQAARERADIVYRR